MVSERLQNETKSVDAVVQAMAKKDNDTTEYRKQKLGLLERIAVSKERLLDAKVDYYANKLQIFDGKVAAKEVIAAAMGNRLHE